MEENRYSDFYEGTTITKLKNILDVIIYNLEDIYQFRDETKKVVMIVQKLMWDGISGNESKLASFLENLAHKMVENKHELPISKYKKIEPIIEPLEIVVTELKLAYTESQDD
ncbi:hypothetical protein D3C87_80280 [compost metagenome]